MRKLNTPSVKILKVCKLFNINSNLLHWVLGLIAYSEPRTKTHTIFIPCIQNSLLLQKSISQIFDCSVCSD